MIASALLAFLHHAAAFTLVAALAAEHLLFSRAIDARAARRLQRLDALYGASAGLLLAIGLARVFFVEKGATYYFENGFFIAKFALFVAVGVASIYPTVVFARWRRRVRQGQAPEIAEAQARRVVLALRVQLAGIAGILLCAALMAKGLGQWA